MLQCPNCHAEQAKGKFCGKCGTTLVEATVDEPSVVEPVQVETEDDGVQRNATSIERHAETKAVNEEVHANTAPDKVEEMATEEVSQSVHEVAAANVVREQERQHGANKSTENVKEQASIFWQYFILLLKNPTKALQLKEEKFVYGLVNILLFAVTFALTLYFAINVYYKLSFGMVSDLYVTENMPFIPVFSRVSFSVIILLAIAVVGIVVIEKISIKQGTFQEIVAQYGGVITPLIFVQVAAIVPALAGSIIITIIILIGTLMFAMFIIPGLVMFEKASKNSIVNQNVYVSLSTTIFNLILTYFILRISALTYLKKIVGELSYYFDELWYYF